MYHHDIETARSLRAAEGHKHLEGVYPKKRKWYARARLGTGGTTEFSFDTEAEAYACWVGMTRARGVLEEKPKMSTEDRVNHIANMGKVPPHIV